RKERIVRRAGCRDHRTENGRSAENCTGLERARAAFEHAAIAPQKRPFAAELERLPHRTVAETLARRGAPETGDVPADESRIGGEIDREPDTRVRSIEDDRLERQ